MKLRRNRRLPGYGYAGMTGEDKAVFSGDATAEEPSEYIGQETASTAAPWIWSLWPGQYNCAKEKYYINMPQREFRPSSRLKQMQKTGTEADVLGWNI